MSSPESPRDGDAWVPDCVFVASRVPWPLNDGWNRRTFHIVQALALRSRVHFIAFADKDLTMGRDVERAWGPNVRVETITPPRFRMLRALWRSLITKHSYYTATNDNPAFAAAVARAMQHRSVRVWASAGAFLANYMPPRRTDGRTVLRVIDTHNIDSIVAKRAAAFIKNPIKRWMMNRLATQLRALEESSFRDADCVLVCSDREIDDVKARASGARVRCIPNGVDVDAFGKVVPGASPRPDTLLFFGRLDYFPNVDAVQYLADCILAPLQALVPDVRIRLVGAGDARQVETIARSHPALDVVGQVSDVNQELQRASVVIVPLRVGGGTRLKVLEALSAGRPMVSTTIGAEGIALTDEVHLLLRDDPIEFARAASRLLRDTQLAAALSQSARDLAIERYSWSAIGEALRMELDSLEKSETVAALR